MTTPQADIPATTSSNDSTPGLDLDFKLLWGPQELKQAAQDVHRDGQRPRVSVRELLRWFRAERRGRWVVEEIREKLKSARLETVPDFESTWLDGAVRLVPSEPERREPAVEQDEEVPSPAPVSAVVEKPSFDLADPAHQLSRLEAANTEPVKISPDDSVEHAVTVMLTNDFSQLPVMTSDREVKGVISWKSIASRMLLGKSCDTVRECMDTHQEMLASQSIFDAINVIAEHDFVLVRQSDKRISGIVTAYDISEQFNKLTEPFLLLGDIETQIRNLIASRFQKSELQSAREPGSESREVEDAADLTFGEYVKLLENPENWNRLQLKLDRKVFIKDLERIRQIRNEVMHFDPDGISDEDLEMLRKFAKFLVRLGNLMRG